jgi:aryl-alcohol dehydrogenase
MTRGGEAVTGRFFGQSSFAEYAIVDRRCLVKIEGDLPPEVAAPLGCGIQTGAGAVLNILRPTPGATIAVFGTGAVGLSAIMAAPLLPMARVIAVDVVASRLDLARELGATDVIDGSSTDVSAAIADLTGGAGLDFAVDTTANSKVTRTITDNLATFGKLAVVGAPPMGTELTVDISAFLVGRCVVGVTEGDSNPEVFIPTLADLYRQGRFPVDRLVTTYGFDDINQAAADAASGAAIKPVLVFDA